MNEFVFCFVFQIPLEVNVCFRVVLMISSAICWDRVGSNCVHLDSLAFIPMAIMYSCPYNPVDND